MTASASSLHKKLAAIRADIGTIGKTGTNTGTGGGYKFVEAVEVARKFVAAASKANLTMVPVEASIADIRESISGKQHVVTLHTAWQITDADTGESIVVHAFGQGADNADKAAPKAQTNAMKYAILLALQAAGDDPEADASVESGEWGGPRQKPASARETAAAPPAAPAPPNQPWTAEEIASVGLSDPDGAAAMKSDNDDWGF